MSCVTLSIWDKQLKPQLVKVQNQIAQAKIKISELKIEHYKLN